MSDWTIVNLKDDVENSAERFGLAPDLEARFGRKALGTEGGGFSYQRLAPDFAQPFGHRHRTQEGGVRRPRRFGPRQAGG